MELGTARPKSSRAVLQPNQQFGWIIDDDCDDEGADDDELVQVELKIRLSNVERHHVNTCQYRNYCLLSSLPPSNDRPTRTS